MQTPPPQTPPTQSPPSLQSIGLEQAYETCRTITRREAKNFYYAFLTLPPAKRRAIYAAYAFCRHCDDSVDEGTSTPAKMQALAALRSDLADTYSGRAASPVYVALADVARQYDIPQDYFGEVIQGVESDLVKDRFQNFEELREYCYRVASVVGLICLQIFGYRNDDAKEHAVDLGLAMQLTNIIRDVREDLDMDRVYLPQDEMARFGYSEEDLRNGVRNQEFLDLMEFQAKRARGYFDRGFKLLPYLSRRSRACPAVLGALYSKVLDRIEASDYDVLSSRVSLSKDEKVRITAQTWLGSMLSLSSPLR
ncbi:MAG: presqualene diphosphate synthase HpnD [Chloroflexi bacterium]|nr:presqualene diphosphate synthase HpnD [Chloroflexota bacterium]MDA1270190.1 presqualene diphosphate synthase HpnD [Chloroflexota bacterium]